MVKDNMSKNTEAIICFILFSHQFFDHSYGSYMIYSSDFYKIIFAIQNKLKIFGQGTVFYLGKVKVLHFPSTWQGTNFHIFFVFFIPINRRVKVYIR